MRHQTLNSAELAKINVGRNNNIAEKFSLVSLALFLLILSIMDCRINDKFSNPFLQQPVFATNNIHGNGSSSFHRKIANSLSHDFYSLFCYGNHFNNTNETRTVKTKSFASNLRRKFNNSEARLINKKDQYGSYLYNNRSAGNMEHNSPIGLISSNNTLNSNTVKVADVKNSLLERYAAMSIPAYTINDIRKKASTNLEVSSLGSHSGISFAAEAGITRNGFYDTKNQNNMTSGIQAGAVVNIDLGNHLAAQTGVKYITKGAEVEATNADLNEAENISMVNKIKIQYMEAPVNMVYKFGKVGETRIIAGGGPYIAQAIKVQNNMQTNAFPQNGANNVKALNDAPENKLAGQVNENTRKLDYGVNGFVGCQTPAGFYAKAGMEAGFRDIQLNANDGSYSSKNYNVTISIGYQFGGNK